MQKPNILFFLIDDLGARDLGCFGSSFYETPHLDKLASEGMLFNQAYASCPVCSPTRASILSGKYPARVGITQWIGGKSEGKLKDVPYLHYLPLEEKSIAQALREQGYDTWHVGKWHLGDEDFFPEKHGFDVNIGGCHMGSPGKGGYFSPWSIENLSNDVPEGTYLTDHITDKAIDLIKNRNDSPFFLNLSHYAVHTPLQAPEPLVEKYRTKAKRLRLDQADAVIEGEHFPPLHREHLKVERRIIQSHPVYAAMMENLDTNIGKVLEAIKQEGIENETIVVFTSDNGGLATAEGSPTCNAPLAEGKGWNQEGGTRVCQIIKWPGTIRPGSQCKTPVTSTDFYPTFLDACGANLLPEQHCDGESLLPLLKEQGPLERDSIFWHYPHYSNQGGRPAASIVSGEWKLIQNFEDNDYELYNLDSDVSETQNLVSTHPEMFRKMKLTLDKWQQEIEAKIPDSNPDYERKSKRPKIPNNACV